MVYDPVHQQTVLFGGCAQNQSGACVASAGQETWVWNGVNWSLASTPGLRHASCIPWPGIPFVRKLFSTGATTSARRVFDTDTWLWDGTSWAELSASIAATPGVPSYMAYDPSMNRMVLLVHGNYLYGVFVKPRNLVFEQLQVPHGPSSFPHILPSIWTAEEWFTIQFANRSCSSLRIC